MILLFGLRAIGEVAGLIRDGWETFRNWAERQRRKARQRKEDQLEEDVESADDAEEMSSVSDDVFS